MNSFILFMRAIPKSTSDWLVKKIQNREQNFIIWNSYIYNCITSPHSCRPHLGTCRTVTLVFVVPLQRTVPPSYAAKSVSLFWYPPCTQLMVTQSVCDNLIQSSPRSLWNSSESSDIVKRRFPRKHWSTF